MYRSRIFSRSEIDRVIDLGTFSRSEIDNVFGLFEFEHIFLSCAQQPSEHSFTRELIDRSKSITLNVIIRLPTHKAHLQTRKVEKHQG